MRQVAMICLGTGNRVVIYREKSWWWPFWSSWEPVTMDGNRYFDMDHVAEVVERVKTFGVIRLKDDCQVLDRTVETF